MDVLWKLEDLRFHRAGCVSGTFSDIVENLSIFRIMRLPVEGNCLSDTPRIMPPKGNINGVLWVNEPKLGHHGWH